MSPADAAAILIEEPDWRALFEEQCARWPKLPRYFQEDSAFPEVMRQWRKFHWIADRNQGRAQEDAGWRGRGDYRARQAWHHAAALAWNDIPRDGETGYQPTTTCGSRSARSSGASSRSKTASCICRRVFQADVEQKQIDLVQAKWDKYTIAAVELLTIVKSLR